MSTLQTLIKLALGIVSNFLIPIKVGIYPHLTPTRQQPNSNGARIL